MECSYLQELLEMIVFGLSLTFMLNECHSPLKVQESIIWIFHFREYGELGPNHAQNHYLGELICYENMSLPLFEFDDKTCIGSWLLKAISTYPTIMNRFFENFILLTYFWKVFCLHTIKTRMEIKILILHLTNSMKMLHLSILYLICLWSSFSSTCWWL